MGEIPMHQYHKPSDVSEDHDSSDRSPDLPPSFNMLEEHGYTVQEKCGQGVSGMVFLVRNADGDPYVVKQMNSRDKEELVEVQKEVEILKKMNCGYIVSYLDSFEDEAAGLFITVMEYCAGGDLSKKMQTQKEKGFFEEEQVVSYADNLLEDAYASSVVGAELYVCPEVYEKKYNSKCDIWSLGWLLHDLCMLDVWANILQCHLLYALSMTGTPPPISERYSEELRELIRQMLSCDPKDRPSADEILAKPFLKEAVDRNKRIPEALEQRLMKSINAFDEAYDKHYKDFEVLVSEWGNITGSMESAHYNATAGSLTGSVIGAAGGITAVVGAILAPFTFGASLIPLFHQGSAGAGSEPVPTREPVLCVSTAKEPVLGQENWFQSGTNSLLD